jgi:hypothetical protein
MKTFKDYLAESVKEYTFKVKIAGVLEDDHLSAMEMALSKYNVVKMSAPKKTIMQEHPLDFPANVTNTEVTIVEVTTSMPVSYQSLSRHLSDYMGLPYESIVVQADSDPLYQEQEREVAKAKAKPEDYKPVMGQPYDKSEEADIKDVVHSEESKKSFLAKLEKASKERANVEVVTGLTESKETETPKVKLTSYIAKGKK